MPTLNHQNPPSFSIVNCTLLIVNWNFTFSAKEKDSETGLSVTSLRSVSSLRLGNLRTSSHCTRSLRRFGSHYYNSDLSIWLSVDPMASKYPSLSPYTYCANNPIKLVDPNGEEIGDNNDTWEYNTTTGELKWIDDNGGYTKQTVNIVSRSESGNKEVLDSYSYKGDISKAFDFSISSPTMDKVISSVIDIGNGLELGAAGVGIGIIGCAMSAGTLALIATVAGVATVTAGGIQLVSGIKQIGQAIDGTNSSPHTIHDMARDVCKSAGSSTAGILSSIGNPSFIKETIKNTASFMISAAWMMAQRNKTIYPKYLGRPSNAITCK